MRRLCILALALAAGAAFAQGPVPLALPPPPAAGGVPAWPLADTSEVTARPVPEATLERFRADPAFDYGRAVAPARPTLWQRAMGWLSERLARSVVVVPDHVLGWVVLGVAAVLLGFGVAHALRMGAESPLARASPAGVEAALREEGIERVDLEAWLRQALTEGRAREAVRLRFLLALQALAATGRVDWTPDKTNRAYLVELRGTPAEAPFAAFAGLFDRVWYGHRPASADDLDAAEAHLLRLRAAAR